MVKKPQNIFRAPGEFPELADTYIDYDNAADATPNENTITGIKFKLRDAMALKVREKNFLVVEQMRVASEKISDLHTFTSQESVINKIKDIIEKRELGRYL